MFAGRTDAPDNLQARPARDSGASTAMLAGRINRAAAVVEGRASRQAPADYRDDSTRPAPFTPTRGELADREPASALLAEAQEALNHLYEVVRHARYDVFLCDDEGVVIDHRGNPTNPDRFKRLDAMNCDGVEAARGALTAPIFDADGKLAGAVGISSVHQALSEWPHDLARAVIQTSARAIEERLFRERHRRTWIIAVVPQDVERFAMLIAVDRDQRIVGADRHARAMLAGNPAGAAASASLWALFEKNTTLFRPRDGGDIPATLVPSGTGEAWSALITPPQPAAAAWPNPASARLQSRPRLDAIGHVHQMVLPRTRGGLSPGVLRRVREYVDAHLEQNIDLERLADIAGLSRCHFARAFKQSVGAAPHSYVMCQRLARAQELLAGTSRSLAEIALMTGFSDQSHFTRAFSGAVGTSPGAWRRARQN
jgi:AraC-like DNA-binding protein